MGGEEAAEAEETEGEEKRANAERAGKVGPHDRKISAAYQDRLRHGHIVCRWRGLHHRLEPGRHAFKWGVAARQEVHRQHHQYEDQRQLRHRARNCAEENAEAAVKEEIACNAKKK